VTGSGEKLKRPKDQRANRAELYKNTGNKLKHKDNQVCVLSCLYNKYFFNFQGQYKFKSPVLKEGTKEQCGSVRPYHKVYWLAVLTAEEMQQFEVKIAHLTAIDYCEFKPVSAKLVNQT
uniref:Uncharacterized protein n=1 Tax=Kryptolebias marmoratus TaxID=37003 RepID=A0A3Q3EJD6_KRYMA